MGAHRLAALALLACLASPAASAGAEDTWSAELGRDLMSPFCPGRTLTDCPSPQAQELRAWITEQERQGRPQAEVEEQLFRLYGDVILAAPRAEGWGLTAYGVPVAAFLAGGVVLAVFLRRQAAAARAAPESAPPAPGDPELERLVDEELGNAAR